jgi:hypothetical protein
MAGLSRLEDGVLSHAYVPAMYAFLATIKEQDVDARAKPAHDEWPYARHTPVRTARL